MNNYSISLLLLGLSLFLFPHQKKAFRHLLRIAHQPRIYRRSYAGVASLLLGLGLVVFLVLTGLVFLAFSLGLAVILVMLYQKNKRKPLLNSHDYMRLAGTWELLAACLKSGLPLPTALGAVAGNAPEQAAYALRTTAGRLALGASPSGAWEPLLQYQPTADFARAAQLSIQSGLMLAETSTELAAEIRATIYEQKQMQAHRAGVFIAGPLGLCFLPAFLCLGVAPIILGLLQSFSF